MSIFSSIYTMIRQVLGRVIPYQNIQQVENIDTPLSQEMQIALEAWHRAYLDKPNYKGKQVKTLNIPAFIASEISRQVTLEFKWLSIRINGTYGQPRIQARMTAPARTSPARARSF